MGSGHHLSLSLSGEMWNQILETALPFPVASGDFELLAATRGLLGNLQLKQRLKDLGRDPRAPKALTRLGSRAVGLWRRRRDDVYRRLGEVVHVEGSWKLEVDRLGTDLRYGHQKVSAKAWVKGVAEGRVTLLREGVVVPFRVERRLGAQLGLGRIRYAREQAAVIGNLQDLAVHLGDGPALQLVGRIIEAGIAQRVSSIPAVPMVTRDQLGGLVGPLGEAMSLGMGVDDVQLDVNDDEMVLKVRFGFTKLVNTPQIEESEVG